MKLAAAQTNPCNKSITENIEDHIKFAEIAAKEGAQIISFPEMSITGYEREKANTMAFSLNDARLNTLRQLASKRKIIIIAGAPILLNKRLHIGSFILMPDGSEKTYTKQYLHRGEEIAFSPSFKFNPQLTIKSNQISVAICADITHPEHAAEACKINSTIYLPSIFFTPTGMPDAYSRLSQDAKQHKLSVLMSNFCGKSYGLNAGGKSAFWNNNGELVCLLTEEKQGILFAEQGNESWNTKNLYL